ncbi:hypothetical protein [uncultured Microscilla sp.]|uniref:hypothetical protein n=1 Tax=uncultured Microscilla sp. TaxID=432653 RepID=UPI00261E7A63|nr:hypothetical protein [uncultured Microscilla sp.]
MPQISYLIFLLLFISTLLWATTDGHLTDKGVAIVFSWVVAPLFVMFLIASDKMTYQDLAIVVGGGGVAIPLVIGVVRKLWNLINPNLLIKKGSKKKQQQETDTFKKCTTTHANMHQHIADTLQGIEQLKKKLWNLPPAQLWQNFQQHRVKLTQALQQIGSLHHDLNQHITHIEQVTSSLETQGEKIFALRQQMQAQKQHLQSNQQEMLLFIQAFDQRQLKRSLDKIKPKYLKLDKRAKKTLAVVSQLTSQPEQNHYTQFKHTLQAVNSLIDEAQHNIEKLEQLLPSRAPLPTRYQSLVNNHEKLMLRLRNAQLELAKLHDFFEQKYIQQSPAYQQLQYEEKKEKLAQKQHDYSSLKKAFEVAQEAVNTHIENLWAIYRQHHPHDSTQSTTQLTDFLRQAYPEALEEFSQKRAYQTLTKAKYRAIEEEIEILQNEVNALQEKYVLDKNSEESIRQLWQSYEHSNNPEEFWQAYEQRLQTLDSWRQAAYLLKS